MNDCKILSKKQIHWFVLIIIIILTAIIRIRLLDVPLERDEGDYAYTAQLMLQGIPPYLKSYSMRLPGLYVAYVVIISLFGQTQQGIHTGLLIINSITIIFVYLLSRFFLSKTGSLVSAATFSFLSLSYSLRGSAANSEHFVVLCATIGLFFLLLGLKKSKYKYLFYSGFILSIGVFMKQNGIFFIILSIIYLVYFSVKTYSKHWFPLVKYISYFLFGIFILAGCSLLIIYYIGIFNEFWFWTFVYAKEYMGQVNINHAIFIFLHQFKYVIFPSPLLWTFIGTGIIFLFIKIRMIKFSFFLILFFLFSFISICPGFYFRNHYFILTLPCVGILAGLTFDSIANLFIFRSKKQFGYYIALILFIVCILQSLYLQRNYLFFDNNYQIAHKIYGPNPFYESLNIAEFITKNTTKNDKVAILGSEPQIFFYSKRQSASGFLYMYPMMEKHKFALAMQKSFIKDIDELKPKYIIFVNILSSWLKRPLSYKNIFKYLDYLINNNKYSLIGLVEIHESESFYYWKPDKIRLPPISKNWIGIYESNRSFQ